MPIDGAMTAPKVAFDLKADVNRVTVEVQGRDESIVITSEAAGPYETSDPEVIRALDESPGMKRAEAPAKKAGK